jgi:prepilin-type N-terminal cleavage/methylation domain-containing protein/prepilin-type processing-associated H-X9-DG protein
LSYVETVVKHGHFDAKGFSLVELLVVAAIIGLLAALLFPALSSAKGYAKAVACRNRLRQMGVALNLYVQDNKSTYPYYLGPKGESYGDATGSGGRALGMVYWSSKLFPYYGLNWTNRAFHCPGYAGKISGPPDSTTAGRMGSYAYNTVGAAGSPRLPEGLGLGPIVFWTNALGAPVPPVSESEVRIPGAMLAMGDSLRKVDWDEGSDFWRCGLDQQSTLAAYALPHGGNYNQLRCDGHVEGLSPSLLFNPTSTAALWNYDHQPHSELWGP